MGRLMPRGLKGEKHICDDLKSSAFSPSPNSGDDVSDHQRGEHMTDRELIGVILSGGGPATLKVPSSDSEKPGELFGPLR